MVGGHGCECACRTPCHRCSGMQVGAVQCSAASAVAVGLAVVNMHVHRKDTTTHMLLCAGRWPTPQLPCPRWQPPGSSGWVGGSTTCDSHGQTDVLCTTMFCSILHYTDDNDTMTIGCSLVLCSTSHSPLSHPSDPVLAL